MRNIVSSFDHYKSARPGGILPGPLQRSLQVRVVVIGFYSFNMRSISKNQREVRMVNYNIAKD